MRRKRVATAVGAAVGAVVGAVVRAAAPEAQEVRLRRRYMEVLEGRDRERHGVSDRRDAGSLIGGVSEQRKATIGAEAHASTGWMQGSRASLHGVSATFPRKHAPGGRSEQGKRAALAYPRVWPLSHVLVTSAGHVSDRSDGHISVPPPLPHCSLLETQTATTRQQSNINSELVSDV